MTPLTLTNKQLETLRAVCDTFVPAVPRAEDPHGFWGRRASEVRVAEAMVEVIGLKRPSEQAEFLQLLDLLGSPLAAASWRGPFRPFAALPPEERVALLRRWSASPVGLFRQGYQVLKRLTHFFFYGLTDETGRNPNWAAIGYPGPLTPPPPPPAVQPIVPMVAGDEVLLCDTVIVGSGAGGGVVAGELAQAGQDVIVVEKGPYVAEDGFTQREVEMIRTLYEAAGTLATKDLGVMVLAGSCLGGGTTVNWSAAFRTPEYVLEEWARAHLLPHLLTPDYQKSFAAVEAMTHVDSDESPCNPQNQALWDGAEALGWPVRPIPRNVEGCEVRACGYCGFGCQHGAKRGTLKSYLPAAHAAGARFLVQTTIHRVLVEAGRAVGVVGTQREPSGRLRPVTIRAKRVVVAAGSLHTPALLRRSGLTHPQIGRNLYLHPTVATAAFYDRPMNPWLGVMMSAVSDQWAQLDGAHGFKVETPPTHPGLLALALPWVSGEQHKATMARAAHVGSFITIVRDRDPGHITLDKQGQPVLHYRLSDYDRRHVMRGVQEACRLHNAAGAETVLMPHNCALSHDRRDGAAALEQLLGGIEGWGWKVNQYGLYSAHQMGSCRMGGDAQRHPLTPDAETREVKNLFVTDSSVFPSASGANPMLSIQAMAHYAAQGIKAGV